MLYKPNGMSWKHGWITPEVLVQGAHQCLSDSIPDLPSPHVSTENLSLVHVMNIFQPTFKEGTSSLVLNRTLQSMEIAAANSPMPLTLVNVQEDIETDCTPAGFIRAAPVTRSTATEYPELAQRRLPFIFDIIDSGAEHAGEDDFLIYTNADICLRPQFYSFVRNIISRGFDAFVVNRRDMDADLLHDDLHLLAEFDQGWAHTGFDCFVFRRSLLANLQRAMCCVGVRYIGWSIFANLLANADRFALFKNVHATYHFGQDERTNASEAQALEVHNGEQLQAMLRALMQDKKAAERLQIFAETEHFLPPAVEEVLTGSAG
ncbi:hypothetical protein [Halocynthiibacter styelae]|uniref:Uncharacterized protein n=1 Tax=Halocynthiibacter styelae TaxID=2761955 RepID=A0A8J7IT18_9RHOB|nr:hypothetical protein [Paenihalocynthiibacter styelae]MBI1495081.1 hypothetical protein [Paenihalocynthiibacter styelae]